MNHLVQNVTNFMESEQSLKPFEAIERGRGGDFVESKAEAQ